MIYRYKQADKILYGKSHLYIISCLYNYNLSKLEIKSFQNYFKFLNELK